MNLDNNLKAALDADVDRHLATAQGTPPPPSTAPAAATSFPLDTLPARAQAYISALEYANGIPPGFMAPAILWAAATATGNAVALEIKPGSRFTAILFLGLIGQPNSNKTQALRAALRPLFDADGEAFEAYKSARAEFETLKADRNGNGSGPRPVFAKTLLNDATPEALAAAHAARLRGIGVYRDELLAWLKSFDRYSSAGESETWLSLWSAAPLAVDRKTAEPIFIKSPFVNVAGTLQPAVLKHLAADDRGRNGFLDRLVFTWPDGLEKPLWTDRGLDLTMRDAYTEAIHRLLALPDDTRIITLAPDARAALFAWYNGDNKKQCDNAPNEQLASLIGKFDIHCARIALALHCLHFAYSTADDLPAEISIDTVFDAIRIAEFFRGMSLKVHGAIFATDPVEALPRDRRKLYDALPAERTFTTADAVGIAKNHGIKERSVKSWLKDRALFEKVSHGVYARTL